MNRRGFLTGMVGILAAGVAPAVLPSGIIMPIRKLWTPYRRLGNVVYFDGYIIVKPNPMTVIWTNGNWDTESWGIPLERLQ